MRGQPQVHIRAFMCEERVCQARKLRGGFRRMEVVQHYLGQIGFSSPIAHHPAIERSHRVD